MKTERNRINAEIYEQASEWFVEFRSGELDAGARRQFVGWLRSSPEHMRAYLELAAIWNEGPQLDPQHALAGLELDEPAGGENVVPFDKAAASATRGNRSARVSSWRWRPTNPWRAMAASFVFACVLGTASYFYSQRNTYATGVGEQRTFTLPDGSTIQLNARSEIRIDYRDDERGVTLKQGQALFKVARSATRPFIVTADRTRVRAVGTQFDVNRRDNGTTVTVVEGRVAVGADAAARAIEPVTAGETAAPRIPARPGEIFLSAGQQATVTAHETHRAANPNVDAVTAWTQQRIVFESASLEDVATEFNRYNTRRLVIQGSQLAQLRITGTFSSTDPGSIIRFLRARPGIVVNESEHEILVTAENSFAR